MSSPSTRRAARGLLRIGVFGGSFNPVHRGHLALATFALSELNLDRVLFVPSHVTPLKSKKDLMPAAKRLSALKQALRRHPRFAVSDIELKRKGVSYTVDTLKALKKRFGSRAQLYFLAGADVPRRFSRWRRPGEVLKLCRFVVATRPGSALRTGDRRFLWMPMPPVDLSSSEIRKTRSNLKRK